VTDHGPALDYVAHLRAGGVLACATETLFGLLADALDPVAVQRVVDLKQRGDAPIALLLPSVDAVSQVAADPLTEAVLRLARAHWPGPLTLVVRARSGLPHAIAPQGTVGVRVPGPSPALDVVRAFGGPLTATSCNPSGMPSARTESQARAYFEGSRVVFVPSDAPGGEASTVLDVSGPEPKLLRKGPVAI